MNYNEQLRKLYKEKKRVKESNELYFDLQTESGRISIPKKVVIKAYNSSIEHFKSRIQYQETLKKEQNGNN
jgi:hypothetical protein